eukprot:GHVQ01014242.1.p1 GENE.GHVQ01014242.1~~GHVQ01014242.1.p1  ORF type:complete len:313 (-),score=59.04 GHVQ01014242.1:262-1200(-)
MPSFAGMASVVRVWSRYVRAVCCSRGRLSGSISRRQLLLLSLFKTGLLPEDIFSSDVSCMRKVLANSMTKSTQAEYCPVSSTFHLEVSSALTALHVEHSTECPIEPFVLDIIAPPKGEASFHSAVLHQQPQLQTHRATQADNHELDKDIHSPSNNLQPESVSHTSPSSSPDLPPPTNVYDIVSHDQEPCLDHSTDNRCHHNRYLTRAQLRKETFVASPFSTTEQSSSTHPRTNWSDNACYGDDDDGCGQKGTHVGTLTPEKALVTPTSSSACSWSGCDKDGLTRYTERPDRRRHSSNNRWIVTRGMVEVKSH